MFDFLKTSSINTIFVCDKDMHQEIQKYYNHTLIPFKIMSYNDFKNYYLGEIKDDVYFDLLKHQVSFELAKVIVKNYFLVTGLNIPDEFIDKYKYIIKSHVKFESAIKDSLLCRPIVFINPDLTDDYIQMILLQNKDIKTIEIKNEKTNIFDLYKSNNIENEVDLCLRVFSFNDLQKDEETYIYYSDKEYLPILKTKLNLLGLKYTTNEKTSFYELYLGKHLVKYLDENYSFSDSTKNLFEKAIEDITKECNISINNLEKIYNICNNFINYDLNDYPIFRCLFIDKLKNTYVENIKDIYNLKIISKLPKSFDQKKIYFLGCNQNKFPQLVKNTDYISDEKRLQYRLLTSKEKNDFNEIRMINNLNSLEKGVLFYNNSHKKALSYLVGKLNTINCTLDLPNNISSRYNDVAYAAAMDNYFLYGKEDENLTTLASNDVNDIYKKYDHSFKGTFNIDKEIKLSFTQFDDFSLCPYYYYLSRILKIQLEEDDYSSKIGDYFHLLLQKLLSGQISIKDIDQEKDIFLNANPHLLDNPEHRFYFDYFKGFVVSIYDFIYRNYHHLQCNQIEYEKNVVFSMPYVLNNKTLDDNINGKIDKYMVFTFNNEKRVLIVDYKTKSDISSYNNVDFLYKGLNSQIPFYFYLLKQTDQKYGLLGGYVEKIIPKGPYDFNPKKDYEQLYSEEMQCNGFGANSYSDFLKQFYLKSRLCSDDFTNDLVNTTEDNIKNTFDNIHKGNFEIKPKIYKTSIDSCKYCKFSSVCYKNFADYEVLVVNKNGGATNDSKKSK